MIELKQPRRVSVLVRKSPEESRTLENADRDESLCAESAGALASNAVASRAREKHGTWYVIVGPVP
jgi:hypothetical protein